MVLALCSTTMFSACGVDDAKGDDDVSEAGDDANPRAQAIDARDNGFPVAHVVTPHDNGFPHAHVVVSTPPSDSASR